MRYYPSGHIRLRMAEGKIVHHKYQLPNGLSLYQQWVNLYRLLNGDHWIYQGKAGIKFNENPEWDTCPSFEEALIEELNKTEEQIDLLLATERSWGETT